jgi:hypothetical protein
MQVPKKYFLSKNKLIKLVLYNRHIKTINKKNILTFEIQNFYSSLAIALKQFTHKKFLE